MTTTHTRGHRFGMPTTGLSQIFLIPFGVSSRRAYAQLHDGKLHVRFGPMFDEQLAVKNIDQVEETRWPRWAGVGPRTNFRGTVGLIASYGSAIKLTFKEPIDVNLFVVPVKCRRLYVSLEEPEEFMKAIGEAKRAEKHASAKAA